MTMIPWDLLPDALDGWVGPVRWKAVDGHFAWDDAVLHVWLPEKREGMMLDLTRPEAAQRACVVLAAGMKCPTCGGSGVVTPLGGTLYGPGLGHGQEGCLWCGGSSGNRGTGWRRKPVPAWHLLPKTLGGTLLTVHGHHSPALIAWHAASVARGGEGVEAVTIVLGLHNAERPAYLAGCARIDADDALHFPEQATRR